MVVVLPVTARVWTLFSVWCVSSASDGVCFSCWMNVSILSESAAGEVLATVFVRSAVWRIRFPAPSYAYVVTVPYLNRTIRISTICTSFLISTWLKPMYLKKNSDYPINPIRLTIFLVLRRTCSILRVGQSLLLYLFVSPLKLWRIEIIHSFYRSYENHKQSKA